MSIVLFWPETTSLPAAFVLSASANIAASGEATTAQLTAPSGKTSGANFQAGRLQDDENPADALTLAVDKYTELEWSIKAVGTEVTASDVYEFRVVADDVALDTYAVTPQATIASSGATVSAPSAVATWAAIAAAVIAAVTVPASPATATWTTPTPVVRIAAAAPPAVASWTVPTPVIQNPIPTLATDAATISLDGVWSWYTDPRAVYDATSDTLFYADVRSNGIVFVHSWDFTRRLYLSGTPKPTALEVDDHDHPALCVLTDGTILTAYSQHNGDSYSARSVNPRDIRTWNTPVQLASGATNEAYVHLMQMGDTANTVYWFFRRQVGATTEMKRMFRTSADGGVSWNSPVELVSLAGHRPYLWARQNGANRVDILLTTGHPNEIVSSVYHFYLLVASDGTRTYFKTDGTSLGNDSNLPFAPSSLTLVYDGSSTNSWGWDLAIFGGNPVALYTSFESSNSIHHYFQARWNGSAWQSDEIATGGTTGTADYLYGAEVNYSGGVTQDPNDVDVVYLSREYGAANFQLEKWTQSGSFPSGTWSKTSNVSGNTGKVNARPYCPRGLSPTRVLWWEGTYTTYASYQTRLRMDPAPAWRAAKETAPVWTPAYAPSGVQAYYLIHEGAGSTVTDLANARNGSVAGSPTWNAGAGDDFGAFLSGFTTADYVNIDALAAAIDVTGYPVWAIVLFKTTDAGITQQWPVAFANSVDTDPLFGPLTNSGTATTVGGFWRDAAGVGPQPTVVVPGVNNGEFHVLYVIKRAANDWKVRFDGLGVVQDLTTTGAVTFDRGAIGARRRATLSEPFAGEVHAVLVGWGAEPDNSSIALDLLHGQFAGTFAVASGVTRTATVAIATWAVPASVLVPGAVTVSAPVATTAWTAPTPAVVSPVTVSAPVATAAWVLPAPSVLQAGAVFAPAAIATWTAPTPTIVPGAVSVAAPVATSAWTLPTAVVRLTQAAGAATASWSLPAPVVLSPVTLSPATATSAWTVPSVTVVANVTRSAPPAVSMWTLPTPGIVAGPVTVQATAAIASWTVPAASTTGAIVRTTTAATSAWTVPAVTVLRVVTLQPTAATATWMALTPTFIPGVTVVQATPGVAVWVIPSPVVVTILTVPSDFISVPSVDRWVGVEATDRWFAVPVQDREFV